MITDGKVDGMKKGRALLHDRRMEGRGEEREAREHGKIKKESSCH